MENPAYLLGIPFLVVGIIGVLLALSELVSSNRVGPGRLALDQSAQISRVSAFDVWPLVVAVGAALVMAGLVIHLGFLIAGAFVAALGMLGWLGEDVLEHRRSTRGGSHGGAAHG